MERKYDISTGVSNMLKNEKIHLLHRLFSHIRNKFPHLYYKQQIQQSLHIHSHMSKHCNNYPGVLQYSKVSGFTADFTSSVFFDHLHHLG